MVKITRNTTESKGIGKIIKAIQYISKLKISNQSLESKKIHVSEKKKSTKATSVNKIETNFLNILLAIMLALYLGKIMNMEKNIVWVKYFKFAI